jgi:hypothetical protein
MLTLSGTILMLIIAILIGKHVKQFHPFTYSIVILLTLVEVGIVLYEMYTMPMPKF